MPAITFNLSADQLTRLTEALAARYNYSTRVPSPTGYVDNPETKAAFVKRKVIEEWVTLTKAHETPPPTPPAEITIT